MPGLIEYDINEPFGTLHIYENSCATATDGAIHVVDYLTFTGPYTYQNIKFSISSDNGVTWSVPVAKPVGDLIFGGLANGTYLIRATGDTYQNSGQDYVGPFEYIFSPITLSAAACPLSATVTGIGPTCATANNGSIAISNIQNGVGPYSFFLSVNGGSFVGCSNPITGLGNGSYIIKILDTGTGSLFFSQQINMLVINPCNATPNYTLTVTTVPPSCNLINDGEIHIVLTGSVLGGPWLFEYQKNGGAWTTCAADIFGLGNGTYNVRVTEIASNYLANAGPYTFAAGVCALDFSLSITPAVCPGINNGIITILGLTGGVAPYTITYTDNGGSDIPVSGSVITGLIDGHTYAVKVVDSGIPTTLIRSVVMTHSMATCTPFVGNINPINPTCVDKTDGYIAINITSGYGPYIYQYTFNGGSLITSASNVILNLKVGVYHVVITDFYGRILTSDFAMTANACPELTQRDIQWANLLCCNARLLERWKEKEEIGDSDAPCLKKRAFLLQGILDVIKNNVASTDVPPAYQTCITDEQAEDLFQLAITICDECECHDSALDEIIRTGTLQGGGTGTTILGQLGQIGQINNITR